MAGYIEIPQKKSEHKKTLENKTTRKSQILAQRISIGSNRETMVLSRRGGIYRRRKDGVRRITIRNNKHGMIRDEWTSSAG